MQFNKRGAKKLRNLDNMNLALKQYMAAALVFAAIFLLIGFVMEGSWGMFYKLLGILCFGFMFLLYLNRQIVLAIKTAI